MESWLVPSVESADAFSFLCTQIRAILQSSTKHWFYSTQCSSPSMVWLPRRLPPSESSFYSSMPEKLCIFLMVVHLSLVQTILGEMDYQNWVPQLLLSWKYKQPTNELQFDFALHRWLWIVVTESFVQHVYMLLTQVSTGTSIVKKLQLQ